MNKRRLLAKIFDATGAAGLMLRLNRRSRSRWLPVVTFHRVAENVPGYRFDDGVIDTTPAAFEEHIRIIRDHFTPVSIRDVVTFLERDELPVNPVLVTMDDGYRDNYEVALPILQYYGVKAAFFIATDYVTHRRVFWWDQIAYLLKATRRTKLALSYPTALELDLSSPARKEASINRVLRVVKTEYDLDLGRFLEHVASAASVVWNDELERRFANELLMTWDQVRGLRAAGMDVQSHTKTHRVLQTLTPEQVRVELHDSRRELEQQLDDHVDAISYPIGPPIVDRPGVRDELARAGYKLGFTNSTGAQPTTGEIDRFNFKRMGMEADTPQSLFRAILIAPRVFEERRRTTSQLNSDAKGAKTC